MKFDEIPAGATVFVDANVFVYAFAGDGKFDAPCLDLLERIELGALTGCTSGAVLSETAHRLMTLEACETFGWPYQGIVQRLRGRPDEIKKLHRFRAALVEISATGLSMHAVSGQDVQRAAALCQQYGLLSNDGLVAAVMESRGLSMLASNDADFDRVPSLHRYSAL